MTPTQQPKPSKNLTQTQIIKNHLMAGKTITTWQAYEKYHITSLAQRVHELRNTGLDIDSKLVTQNGKTFSIYWVEEKLTDAERVTLNQYIKEGC